MYLMSLNIHSYHNDILSWAATPNKNPDPLYTIQDVLLLLPTAGCSLE